MNRKISISVVDVSNKTWHFEGLRELHDFIQRESKYWKEKQDAVTSAKKQAHPYISNASGLLEQIAHTIDSWNENLKDWDDATLNQKTQSLNTSQIHQLQNYWLWSGHPYTNIFVNCNKTYSHHAATAFIDLILRSQITNITNRDTLFGILFAYEYLNQDSDLTKRRDSEKTSLDNLRNNLEETTTQLISEVENFKEELGEWDKETKNNWHHWLETSKIEHANLLAKNSKEFSTYLNDCITRISDLENTYQEKLRLEKPASYWKQSARTYGIQGGLWFFALLLSLLLGIFYFRDFFITWLSGNKTDVELSTIEGVILFGSVVTIYAFMVKVLSRLTFSSFHLMRDAQEREQLSYLYLALTNNKNIDEKSRDIVLQALFSRTDTGLLTAESGPTMPVVSEILKTARKQ